MNKISLAAVLLLASCISFGQSKISIDSVNNHIGEKVTVCSEVYGIKSMEKVTFINLGKAYPNSPLTLVVFAKDRANFSDTIEKLYGNKPVCVSGVLKEYKGKPEIIISKPEDIIIQ